MSTTGRPVPLPVGGTASVTAGEALTATTEPVTNPDTGAPGGRRERAGVVRVGLAFTYLACFTTPWTAVGVGSLRLGDIFLFFAVITMFVADINARLPHFPEWVWVFAASIVFIGVLHEVFPTSAAYLANRVSPYGGTLFASRGVPSPFSNFGVMVKFLVPIIGLPLLFGLARAHDSRVLRRSAIAFGAGAAVSALIAFTDVEGLTAIAQQVSGIGVSDARGAGLTEHPNYVAMGCVFGLPVLLWQTLSPRLRDRSWAIVGSLCLLLGLYASGSRAGGGAGAVVLVLSFVIIPGFRRILPATAPVAALITAGAFVVYPSLGNDLLHALRLTNDAGAGSDLARTIINDQGERDFAHSPIVGVGLQVAGEAHIVYLQALAAGGIILLTGYVIFLLGSLVRCLRAFWVDEVAAPLFVSILGGAIFNAAQDALTLRIVYVPATLAAMLPLAARARSRHADDPPSVATAVAPPA